MRLNVAFPTAMTQSLSDEKCLSLSQSVPTSMILTFFSGSGSCEFYNAMPSMRTSHILQSYEKEETGRQTKALELSFSRSRTPTFLGLKERITWDNVGKGE